MEASKAGALLFLHAQTPMHPGSGTALGVVDLPIQRERHTQWPVIPGSALKGILRDACREKAKGSHGNDRRKANKEDKELTTVFGPGEVVDDASSFAGAISITDARILAFPVRSLKGVFAWVTCPAVLERLTRDASLAGQLVPAFTASLKKSEAACKPAPDCPLLLEGNALVFEEFEFKRVGDATAVSEWISKYSVNTQQYSVNTQQTTARIRDHLVVLHDDDFTHFVRHATEVSARIGLDYETKTVRKTALFYEEFLPAETLMYSVVLAAGSRKEGNGMTAGEVLAYLRQNLPPVLQVGADETIGKGLCIPKLFPDGR
jgi:CRISPR-associated protein Cmr4